MRISLARIRLELAHTFRIARSADQYRESVIVRLEDGGLDGLGEAAPSPRYGQSAESAERALASLDAAALEPAEQIEDVLGRAAALLKGEKAALAAVDMALHDLLGKRLGSPLYAVLGLDPGKTPVTSYTIGIDAPEIIADKIAEAEDFPVLKVKMGLDNDREIMETVRRLTDRRVRIDANEGWTREEALEKALWLETQNVELIEQPLPAADLEGARWLAARTSIPIFADESVHVASDIPRLAGIYRGINIKLMKCGGIHEALRMIHAARERGMEIMLGCMIESSIGITAAAQLSPLVDYADLDGNILIGNDPASGVKAREGKLALPDGPGLGVTIVESRLSKSLKRARA
ncbi:MAG: dipeptide epimerase [Candidatus Krumholzibacteria bacterium]|nr:dipeptide epimerase [Candidatus Krumholzibacteria bacterium]